MQGEKDVPELKILKVIDLPWMEEEIDDCQDCLTSCQSACKTSCTVGNIICEKKRR